MDLNADVGEREVANGADDELLAWVTTANIACGGHAGTPEVMAEVVRTCRERDVAVSAHVSYPDRAGFGRRPMDLPADELTAALVEQLEGLATIAAELGMPVRSVKPHGALYHAAAAQDPIADALAEAVAAVGPLPVVLPARAATARRYARRGLAVVAEGFADRAYRPDGQLVPRGEPGAVLADPGRAAAQARSLACNGGVRCADGSWLPLTVQTVCVHGDTPGAATVAAAVRRAWAAADVPVRALGT